MGYGRFLQTQGVDLSGLQHFTPNFEAISNVMGQQQKEYDLFNTISSNKIDALANDSDARDALYKEFEDTKQSISDMYRENPAMARRMLNTASRDIASEFTPGGRAHTLSSSKESIEAYKKSVMEDDSKNADQKTAMLNLIDNGYGDTKAFSTFNKNPDGSIDFSKANTFNETLANPVEPTQLASTALKFLHTKYYNHPEVKFIKDANNNVIGITQSSSEFLKKENIQDVMEAVKETSPSWSDFVENGKKIGYDTPDLASLFPVLADGYSFEKTNVKTVMTKGVKKEAKANTGDKVAVGKPSSVDDYIDEVQAVSFDLDKPNGNYRVVHTEQLNGNSVVNNPEVIYKNLETRLNGITTDGLIENAETALVEAGENPASLEYLLNAPEIAGKINLFNAGEEPVGSIEELFNNNPELKEEYLEEYASSTGKGKPILGGDDYTYPLDVKIAFNKSIEVIDNVFQDNNTAVGRKKKIDELITKNGRRHTSSTGLKIKDGKPVTDIERSIYINDNYNTFKDLETKKEKLESKINSYKEGDEIDIAYQPARQGGRFDREVKKEMVDAKKHYTAELETIQRKLDKISEVKNIKNLEANSEMYANNEYKRMQKKYREESIKEFYDNENMNNIYGVTRGIVDSYSDLKEQNIAINSEKVANMVEKEKAYYDYVSKSAPRKVSKDENDNNYERPATWFDLQIIDPKNPNKVFDMELESDSTGNWSGFLHKGFVNDPNTGREVQLAQPVDFQGKIIGNPVFVYHDTASKNVKLFYPERVADRDIKNDLDIAENEMYFNNLDTYTTSAPVGEGLQMQVKKNKNSYTVAVGMIGEDLFEQSPENLLFVQKNITSLKDAQFGIALISNARKFETFHKDADLKAMAKVYNGMQNGVITDQVSYNALDKDFYNSYKKEIDQFLPEYAITSMTRSMTKNYYLDVADKNSPHLLGKGIDIQPGNDVEGFQNWFVKNTSASSFEEMINKPLDIEGTNFKVLVHRGKNDTDYHYDIKYK